MLPPLIVGATTAFIGSYAPMEDELALMRQVRAMKARLAELELLHATRVPTSTSTPEGKHGLSCGFHPQVAVSMTTPEVKCSVCGAVLSPLDVLRQFAKKERTFAHTLEHLRKEADALRLEVAELKRQRSAAKAALKRGVAAKK